ncbi:hypothetical protein DFH29DRAFT_875368 [Suillus ampliporus]|nr:hypothetical protein DFH29DRAFT_875368 [Suillus ampliporus]
MLTVVASPSHDLDDIFSQVASLDVFDLEPYLGEESAVRQFLIDERSTGTHLIIQIDWGIYGLVSDIIDENDALLGRRRLTYYEDDRTLLVETRSFMHEALFNHLSSQLYLFLRDLDYDKDLVYTLVSMSSGLISATLSPVPDMVIRIEALYTSLRERIPIIGECAFSQDTDLVLRKIRHEVVQKS